MKNNYENSKVFIFAGEVSGDLHGAHLLKILKSRWPSVKFQGVGGPRMRTEGLDCLIPMESFQVMGFSDVLMALPSLWKSFRLISTFIIKSNPLLVILIDYPGFNLRLAKTLRKKGFKGKIVQYICPTVWAWGKHRIQGMAKTLDLLLTVYPFEADCFSHTSLTVKYIGNLIQESISLHSFNEEWIKAIKAKSHENLIAIFPGSRKGEIIRNFPKIVKALILLKQNNANLSFGISCADDALKPLLNSYLEGFLTDFFLVPRDYSYELMKSCQTAIAKSGTVTLELALLEKPTVVVYQLSRLNRFIAKYILRVRLPFYCIVNILCKKEVFPELITHSFSPSQVFNLTTQFHSNNSLRHSCLSECVKIPALLKIPIQMKLLPILLRSFLRELEKNIS